MAQIRTLLSITGTATVVGIATGTDMATATANVTATVTAVATVDNYEIVTGTVIDNAAATFTAPGAH